MNIYKSALIVAGVCLLASLVMLFGGNYDVGAPLLVAFFVALSIGFRGNPILKGFAFTMIIFAVVVAALQYPTYFTSYGDYKFSKLIKPLIQIIMFGMGTEMSLRDFAGVAKTPKAVLIGLAGHFTVMPLLGFTLAKVFGFEPEIAAGVVLIGSMPCGLASNVMSYLANANLALSVTLTAVATLLAPVITPIWMKVLGGQFVEVNMLDMMWEIVQIVIIPIGGGLLFNKFMKGKADWLDKAMPILSMFGIACVIIIIVAGGRDKLILIGPALIICAFIHNSGGYMFGYWTARLFKLQERDCRTIAIEVGMQNGGLAASLATSMGKAGTIGLAAAVFSPIMNITGSILASYWHRKPPVDKDEVVIPT
jgi:bile acid:Na+ symporter, BASS family